MARTGRASDAEIELALARLQGWQRTGEALVKTYEFGGFKASMAFANTVAELAGRADHHPDINIQYHRVTLTLSSHDAKGVTEGRPMLSSDVVRHAVVPHLKAGTRVVFIVIDCIVAPCPSRSLKFATAS